MNYDIYHSSITYFPLLPLSKTVSFERKVLDIRQMPAQVLFPHWDNEFEFIYVLSGMMEFRVRQKAFLVSSGEGFFLNTGGRFIPLVYISLMTAALLSIGSALLFFFRQKIILYIKNISNLWSIILPLDF